MRILKSVLNISNLGLIAVSSLLVSLAGCGGGGVDSTSSGGGGVPAAVTITSANASTVAGAAFSTAFGSMGVPVGVQTTTAPSSTNLQRLGRINSDLVKQLAAQSNAPATVTGAVTTTPCTISGTYTFNQTSPTAGVFTYNSCVNYAGETLSGTISVANVALSGNVLSFDAVYNVTLTMPSDVVTVTGDMHYVYNTVTYDETMSGSSLSFSSAATGTRAITSYSISFTGSPFSAAFNFTFSSSVMGGSATLVTTTPFSGPGNYPNAGAATVSGANSTVLRITVLGDDTAPSNSQVELEVSSNGGATYGTPSYVTWTSLNI